MARYNYELPDWPRFRWNAEQLAEPLAAVSRQQGRLIGRMEGLGFNLRQEAVLQTLTADVLKTSEIEGERLDAQQVRSSIALRLGIELAGLTPADRHVEGVVEMMLDATRNYRAPLTSERLFAWHAALFPTGRSGMARIIVGNWRDDRTGPMQVVSGPIGKETVHFEAPPASRMEKDMAAFLDFFNANAEMDPILKAALAHLWFVTIHPFEDGNGRIARAIGDMQLARSEKSSQRFYSMSAQIREERNAYYQALERTQSETMEITIWMQWFLACLGRAIANAQETLGAILRKAAAWERLSTAHLNERQKVILNRLIEGFEGKLTSGKWAKIANCSHDTALRDIQDLIAQGILVQNPGGGRSVSYALADVIPQDRQS